MKVRGRVRESWKGQRQSQGVRESGSEVRGYKGGDVKEDKGKKEQGAEGWG